jgi:hypothetical protein
MAEECLDEVNERTSFPVTVAFSNEDGNPVTPDLATYRIDDEASRTNIAPVTSVGSLDTSIDILVTSEQNLILRSRRDSEVRIVTVEFDYTSATFGAMHGTSQYRYRLINLRGVVDVASPSMSPSASGSPS